jgi:hypothetical protein
MVYMPKGSTQSIKYFPFSHLLVFFVLLSCFARLCCLDEKSNRFSLTRQGLTLFHESHQVFVQTRQIRQLLATLCVTSSLTLVALGGSDPTQRVLPLNPEHFQI